MLYEHNVQENTALLYEHNVQENTALLSFYRTCSYPFNMGPNQKHNIIYMYIMIKFCIDSIMDLVVLCTSIIALMNTHALWCEDGDHTATTYIPLVYQSNLNVFFLNVVRMAPSSPHPYPNAIFQVSLLFVAYLKYIVDSIMCVINLDFYGCKYP